MLVFTLARSGKLQTLRWPSSPPVASSLPCGEILTTWRILSLNYLGQWFRYLQPFHVVLLGESLFELSSVVLPWTPAYKKRYVRAEDLISGVRIQSSWKFHQDFSCVSPPALFLDPGPTCSAISPVSQPLPRLLSTFSPLPRHSFQRLVQDCWQIVETDLWRDSWYTWQNSPWPAATRTFSGSLLLPSTMAQWHMHVVLVGVNHLQTIAKVTKVCY